MENYEEKRDWLIFRQYSLCPVCNKPINITDCTLHHKFEDGKRGNFKHKNFPHFIDSIANLQAVHLHCHIGEQKNPTGQLQHYINNDAEKYERFLERHPRFSAMLNCK